MKEEDERNFVERKERTLTTEKKKKTKKKTKKKKTMPTDDETTRGKSDDFIKDDGKKKGEDFARLHRENDAKALLLKEKCEEISALNKHVEQYARATKRAEEERTKEREEAERWKREEKKMKVRLVGETFCGVSFRMILLTVVCFFRLCLNRHHLIFFV